MAVAGFKFFESVANFLRAAMDCDVVEESCERFGQRVMAFMPCFAKHCFGHSLAVELSCFKTDKTGGHPVAADDDGCFVLCVGYDHASMLPVPCLRCRNSEKPLPISRYVRLRILHESSTAFNFAAPYYSFMH